VGGIFGFGDGCQLPFKKGGIGDEGIPNVEFMRIAESTRLQASAEQKAVVPKSLCGVEVIHEGRDSLIPGKSNYNNFKKR
jgi:hypothetical protein